MFASIHIYRTWVTSLYKITTYTMDIYRFLKLCFYIMHRISPFLVIWLLIIFVHNVLVAITVKRGCVHTCACIYISTFMSLYTIVFYLLGYHLCSYCYYMFLPLVVMRLSPMITAMSSPVTTIYSLLFAIFLFNNEVHAIYIRTYTCMYIHSYVHTILPWIMAQTFISFQQFFSQTTKWDKHLLVEDLYAVHNLWY